MNFWGFPAKEGCVSAYLDVLEQGFKKFFEKSDKARKVAFHTDSTFNIAEYFYF